MISKVLRKYNYFIPIEHILGVHEDIVPKDSSMYPIKIKTLDLDKDIELNFSSKVLCTEFMESLLNEIDEFFGLC